MAVTSGLEETIDMGFTRDIVVVGGCGHVGLPLGVAFAERGLSVALYDVNQDAVDAVSKGRIPFSEPGLAEALPSVLGRTLVAVSDPSVVGALRRDHGGGRGRCGGNSDRRAPQS
jgi:UDP-N-acetyl-D-mannosaminuronate dehydrogenase